jgi:ATP/maltotriose-dependent transcriptional regulator MalT
VRDIDRLSVALLALEEEIHGDVAPTLGLTRDYERQARALGDDLLVARARLCQARVHARGGDVAEAAKLVRDVHRWTVQFGTARLTARTHLVWSNLDRDLGDAGHSLAHAVLCVELLDETATQYMRIWHRVTLGGALGATGSIEAARRQYREAADLATRCGRPDLLLRVLTNYAYAEYASGGRDLALLIVGRLQDNAAVHGLELDAAALGTIGAIREHREPALLSAAGTAV